MRRLTLAVAVLAATALTDVPASRPQDEATAAFLRNMFHYSVADLRELEQGRPVVRTLESTDGREIALAGAIRVAISPTQYVEQLRDIVEFKRHEAVRQIGTFGAAPSPSDLAGLTLDNDHLGDLRGCRLHDCDIQLSRAAIERMRTVRWSANDATQQATRTLREILTQLVAQYLSAGDSALMTYEDQRVPLSVADEFRAMIAPPAILRHFPTLERHITQFPAGRVAGTNDVIYWSKEDVGPKVIISVTHLAIQAVAGEGPVAYAAASKQLYGSHYFDSSLGLTLLLRDNLPSSTVLVYVNRSRVDVLAGFLGGLKRAIVRSRARAAMEDTLLRIRTRLPARIRGTRPDVTALTTTKCDSPLRNTS
jgi:hypothetical protein